MSLFDRPDTNVSWYKKTSRLQTVSSDERDRIHHQGDALFFFDLRPDDSGLYVARETEPSGRCLNHPVEIEVFDASHWGDRELRYGEIDDADQNKAVPCPMPIASICRRFTGSFTWFKDFSPLQGQHEETLWIKNATKADEGLYTCVCSWRHNNRSSNSSGSTEMIHREPSFHRSIILSPTVPEMFVDEGAEVKLNCSFFCGTNVRRRCPVTWHVDGEPFNETEGYSQTVHREVNPLGRTVDTAILTIGRVSPRDFKTEFKCFGAGKIEIDHKILTLKRRPSVVPSVVARVCALLSCVLVVAVVKCFAVDLALFFRSCIPFHRHTKDTRLYDAYVAYQTQGMDPPTERSLSRFVTNILPSVLEDRCGYRLFIHGRDDIPGEDRLERVEDCMRQSRRLMVILTPAADPGSECVSNSPQTSVAGDFDWQVGLHHALVQREMSVILIQLGPTGPGGYSHLPLGLQHLIRQSAPIVWREGSRGASEQSSRFWKRVRYLMPAKPAGTFREVPPPLMAARDDML